MVRTRLARRTRRGVRRIRRSKHTRPFISRSLATKVRRIINKNSEKKYKAWQNSTNVDNTGYLLKFEVAQGDTDSTRDGDQLMYKSLQVHWDASLADTYNYVRLIIFQWFPEMDTFVNPPALSDILLDTATAPWLSPYSHDMRFNFRILYDKLVRMDAYHPVINKRVFIKKFARYKQQFYAGSSSKYCNGLFAYIVSDSSAVAHPTVAWSVKLNFSDR